LKATIRVSASIAIKLLPTESSGCEVSAQQSSEFGKLEFMSLNMWRADADTS